MRMARRLCALLLVLCMGLLTACGPGENDGAEADLPIPSADREPVTHDAAPTTATPTTDTPDGADQTATATAAPAPEPTADAEDEEEANRPSPTADDSKESELDAAADELPEGTITALLIGNDSRENDFAGLSDVIVVVQLSADREDLHLVSIARDSYVDIPGYGRSKINEAYARGGIPLLRQTVSDLLGGLEIDFVAQTNFDMFIALTRWMDGFWVQNQHASTVTVNSTGRQVVFEQGRIFLENTDGLIYVRERKTMPLGDLDRTERHRAALVGMMERLAQIRADDPAKLLELLPMIYQNVKIEGDLSLAHLVTMVEIGSELDADDITSLMVPVSHFGTSPAGASVNILDAGRTAELGQALRAGDLSGYVDRYGTSYQLTGG